LKQEICVYSHILIPTDGSELSKMALYEGVVLAKALGARVSVITVTTPFHVFTRTPSKVTDTPEQYKKHMAARAGEYLDVAKNIAAAAGVTCDLVHLEHEQPYQAIIETAQNRGCDAIHVASHGRRGSIPGEQGGFKQSPQRRPSRPIEASGQAHLRAFSNQASCGAGS
jgi:nucleotide-binding universal stress UspA family protein